MALLETLRLNNDTTGVNVSIWLPLGTAGNIYSQTSGFSVQTGADTSITGYTTNAAYDLTASYFYVDVDSIRPTQAPEQLVYPVVLRKDSNNAVYWVITDEKIKAYKQVAGVTTLLSQTTYNRATHRSFRIRESSGTVYFDYSRDRVTWTNLTSATVASLFAVTALRPEIRAGRTDTVMTDLIIFDAINIVYASATLLNDNFDDNSLDLTKWFRAENNITLSETNQRIEMLYPGSTPANSFAYLENRLSTSLRDFNGAVAYAQIVQVPNIATDAFVSLYVQSASLQNYVRWAEQSGTLYAQVFTTASGITTTIASFTHNSTTHKWWRIKESAGTFYFDTSSDGIEWKNRATYVYDFSLASVIVGVESFTDSNPVSSGGYYIVDNINTHPSVITLTGGGVITTDAKVIYHPTETLTGGVAITAFGRSLADQSAIEKTYQYKVYDTSNNFLGMWNDVVSDFTYDQEINSAGSSIQVSLARNSDSRIVQLQGLITSNTSEAITTQDSNALVILNETANSIGPGTTVDVNLRLEVWVFYGEITEITTTAGDILLTDASEPLRANFGAVNGLRRFNGYITRYVSKYGGDESVEVSATSFGVELDNYVLESASNTTVTYTGQDPSTILTTTLALFNTAGGRVTYSSGSVASTGTTASYTFRLNTYLEVIRKCLELAPYNWYWYVGLGDDLVYFNVRPSTTSHLFILGKHVKELNLEYSIENITNVVYFTGGEVTPEVNLYKKYTDATSITNYRQGLQRISDHRVTVTGSADLISNAEISRNSTPRYRSSITLLDEAYDIESLQLGQLIGFRNFGNYIDALTLQIVGIRYEPHQATLQLDTLLPSVNKAVEDLRRNLIELDNEQNPSIPT